MTASTLPPLTLALSEVGDTDGDRRGLAPLTAEEIEQVEANDSYTEAMVEVFHGRGHRVYTHTGRDVHAILIDTTYRRTSKDNYGNAEVAASRPGSSAEHEAGYTVMAYNNNDERGWFSDFLPASALQDPSEVVQATLRKQRRKMFERALQVLRGNVALLTSLLAYDAAAEGKVENVHFAPMRATALLAWWEDRLTEGHTHDSALMLARLLLPSHVVGRLRFDVDDLPYLRT